MTLKIGDRVEWIGQKWARVELKTGVRGTVVRADVLCVDWDGKMVVVHYPWHTFYMTLIEDAEI